MTVIRRDFEIQLDKEEVDIIEDAQKFFSDLVYDISEQLSDNEKETQAYEEIKRSTEEILANILNFFKIPEIISE